MKFLEKYNFKKDEIDSFVNECPQKIVESLKEHKKLVCINMDFLVELGVKNYKDIFMKFYDMFLMDNSNFIDVFNKYDREDLIDKLEKNIAIVEFL